MNKTAIMNTVTRKMHRIGFKCKKYSPEILIVAGVVGTVTSAVMACKATTKLSKVMEEHKEKVEEIHSYVDENGYSEKYTEADQKKDVTIVYTQTAMELVKMYAPAVALGALSLTAVITSNNILRKRNVALAAAYATIDKSFKDYRGRVVERFGEQLDKELRFNLHPEQVEQKTVDENGKETTETKLVNVMDPQDPNTWSDYARFFDDGCAGWCKDPEHNLYFLKQQQRYANDLLQTRGHLFLNEVYDMLGIKRSTAGQSVGWLYDEKNPVGDNFVDFGIYDVHDSRKRDFVNGYERVILLDFNVDGDIQNMI